MSGVGRGESREGGREECITSSLIPELAGLVWSGLLWCVYFLFLYYYPSIPHLLPLLPQLPHTHTHTHTHSLSLSVCACACVYGRPEGVCLIFLISYFSFLIFQFFRVECFDVRRPSFNARGEAR